MRYSGFICNGGNKVVYRRKSSPNSMKAPFIHCAIATTAFLSLPVSAEVVPVNVIQPRVVPVHVVTPQMPGNSRNSPHNRQVTNPPAVTNPVNTAPRGFADSPFYRMDSPFPRTTSVLSSETVIFRRRGFHRGNGIDYRNAGIYQRQANCDCLEQEPCFDRATVYPGRESANGWSRYNYPSGRR